MLNARMRAAAAATVIAALAVSTLLLAGCGQAEGDEEQASANAARADASWLVEAAPANAVDVSGVKRQAAEGDRVVVRGVIGGRRDAISEESPVFVIMDPAIPSCADDPGDACATPWDYCCETPQVIAANSATVQVIGADATPRAAGLEELDEVIVEGVIGPRPSGDVLVIRAERVHRVEG